MAIQSLFYFRFRNRVTAGIHAFPAFLFPSTKAETIAPSLSIKTMSVSELTSSGLSMNKVILFLLMT